MPHDLGGWTLRGNRVPYRTDNNNPKHLITILAGATKPIHVDVSPLGFAVAWADLGQIVRDMAGGKGSRGLYPSASEPEVVFNSSEPESTLGRTVRAMIKACASASTQEKISKEGKPPEPAQVPVQAPTQVIPLPNRSLRPYPQREAGRPDSRALQHNRAA